MATLTYKNKDTAPTLTDASKHTTLWTLRGRSDYVIAAEFDFGFFDMSEFNTTTTGIVTTWTLQTRN